MTTLVIVMWMMVSILFATAAVYFTKQKVLRGRYAVLWLSTSFSMLGLSLLSLYGTGLTA
ncbi:hypothetical protein ACE3MZ_09525 [Paenibacillus sp. WLX1005]|uniref:hypothetical protein n=1 Tax=unclassified Paenibacillus TaxID=185978 RepID=UPI003984357A